MKTLVLVFPSLLFFFWVLVLSSCGNGIGSQEPALTQDRFEYAVKVRELFLIDLGKWLVQEGSDSYWSHEETLPTWLHLDKDKSRLYGTPYEWHVGEHKFSLNLVSGSKTLRASVQIQVVPTASSSLIFSKPQYTYSILATKPFQLHLKSLLSHHGNGQIQWALSPEAPVWLQLDTQAARIYGTPRWEDLGVTAFKVFAISEGSGNLTEIQLSVKAGSFWADPVDLGQHLPGKPFSIKLNQKIRHPSGDMLHLSPTHFPDWLKITSDNVLVGSPEKSYSGRFQARLGIYHKGKFLGEALLEGRIKGKNTAPVWSYYSQLPPACVGAPYRQTLQPMVYDAEGDRIRFKLLDNPVTGLSLNGHFIEIDPGELAEGNFTIKVQASDGHLASNANLLVRIFECR